MCNHQCLCKLQQREGVQAGWCLLPLDLQQRCQLRTKKTSRLKAMALHAPAAQALSANPAAWLLGLAALVAGTALAAFLVAAVPTLLVRTVSTLSLTPGCTYQVCNIGSTSV